MFEHQGITSRMRIEDSDLGKMEKGAKNLFLRDGSGKHHFLVTDMQDLKN